MPQFYQGDRVRWKEETGYHTGEEYTVVYCDDTYVEFVDSEDKPTKTAVENVEKVKAK